MEQIINNEDYLLTLFEVCEILGKSSRTITRYVHKHILHPRGVKSRQGTLEYRFSRAEVDAFKQREDRIRHYIYTDNKELPSQATPASFADYQYPAPPAQLETFLIPGISYRAQTNPPVFTRSAKPTPPVAATDLSAAKQADKIEKLRPEIEETFKKNDFSAVKIIDNAGIQTRGDGEIISLLKETTGMLRDQLKVKDDQIKNLDDKIGQLIERNRETNILLKGLQDKIMLLENPKNERDSRIDHSDNIQTGHSLEQREDSQTAQQQTTLPDEENDGAVPVKVKISSEVSGLGQEGSRARIIPQLSAHAPRPTKSSDEPEKKSLFGRLFG